MINYEFEERSGLPSEASREILEQIGGRYFSTEPFELQGKTIRYEQIQLGNSSGEYMWKRLSSEGEGDFQIHLEITPNNTRRHRTSYCSNK